MNYGEKIKELRLEKGLTQGDLALSASITSVTLSNIENGKAKATVSVLQRIAKALDCKLEILFNPIVYVVDPVSEEIKQV